MNSGDRVVDPFGNAGTVAAIVPSIDSATVLLDRGDFCTYSCFDLRREVDDGTSG